MARRNSVKKKGSFAVKAVAGGLLACAVAAAIGFASTSISSPDEVSLGLGSSGSFQSRITVSSAVQRPTTTAASVAQETSPASLTGEKNGSSAETSDSAGAVAVSSSSSFLSWGSSWASSSAGAASVSSGAGGADGATGSSGTGSSAGVAGTVGSSGESSASSSASTDVFAQSIATRSALNDLAPCDISAGLKVLSDNIEAERRAAEEARRIAELEHIQSVQAKQRAYGGQGAVVAVDFWVGRQAFVEEWPRRIDAYLAGSNLAGHGSDFAEAAWEYGIDPRWSPAISNTESGKGAHCFLPYNAWGWGASIWFNWTDAIWGHVKGLSEGYGYSITYSAAAKYCPPNTSNWYSNTLSEMSKI